jgi:hypothetical protein
MRYSTFLHSGIVNPAKSKLTKESADAVDIISMDVPFLTRILELAREDIGSDVELHEMITKIIEIKNQGPLTMNHYDNIVAQKSEPDLELESIKKLAGI